MHTGKICLLIGCLFAGCISHRPQTINPVDEQNIVATCIQATLGTKDSARYYQKLSPILPGAPDMQSSLAFNDSMRKLLDTADVYLMVKDTLFNNPSFNEEDLKWFIKKYYDDYDASVFMQQSKGIQKQPVPLPVILNLDTIAAKCQMRILCREERINDEARLIGRCFFSSILFNRQKTKAAVVLNYFSRKHIGYGECFLLRKTKNQWVITVRERTWVS